MWSAIAQPTQRREKQSRITATYSGPSQVATCVRSATHSALGRARGSCAARGRAQDARPARGSSSGRAGASRARTARRRASAAPARDARAAVARRISRPGRWRSKRGPSGHEGLAPLAATAALLTAGPTQRLHRVGRALRDRPNDGKGRPHARRERGRAPGFRRLLDDPEQQDDDDDQQDDADDAVEHAASIRVAPTRAAPWQVPRVGEP